MQQGLQQQSLIHHGQPPEGDEATAFPGVWQRRLAERGLGVPRCCPALVSSSLGLILSQIWALPSASQNVEVIPTAKLSVFRAYCWQALFKQKKT